MVADLETQKISCCICTSSMLNPSNTYVINVDSKFVKLYDKSASLLQTSFLFVIVIYFFEAYIFAS